MRARLVVFSPTNDIIPFDYVRKRETFKMADFAKEVWNLAVRMLF